MKHNRSVKVRTVQYSDQLLQEAKNFFLKEGRSDFLMKKPLSLCGRYCISQKMKELGFLHFIPEDGEYQCGAYTFAISYSEDKLFFALDTQNIVVDVEKIRERNFSLLSPPLTTREVFYMHRCAKECLVKWLNVPLDEVEAMVVLGVISSDEAVQGFSQQVLVEYQGKEYQVAVKLASPYVYAVMKTP